VLVLLLVEDHLQVIYKVLERLIKVMVAVLVGTQVLTIQQAAAAVLVLWVVALLVVPRQVQEALEWLLPLAVLLFTTLVAVVVADNSLEVLVLEATVEAVLVL
jgi:hypothetical protein